MEKAGRRSRGIPTGSGANITEKGLKKRDEILAVADRLFRSHGYEKATMRMIAEQAGISPGHLVHYFRKKEEVLFVLLDDLLGRIWATSADMTRGQDPFAVYAFSHTWFFLTASTLPDLRRILAEGLRDYEIQRYFTKRLASYMIRLLEDRGLARNEADIQKALTAAQAAHFALLAEAGPSAGGAEVAALSSTHAEIFFHLLGVGASKARAVKAYVEAEIGGYTVEDIVAPFTHDYTWYEIEKHPLELGPPA